MKQTTIPVKENINIEIKASENLSIEGSQVKFLTAVVKMGEALKISEHRDGLEIKATSDCRLIVPESAIITVEKVGGDLAIRGINTRLILGKIGGDLTMQGLGGASVETVGGDVRFSELAGALEIVRVGGDLDGEGVPSLSSRTIGGDASLLGISGLVNFECGGDAALSIASEKPSAMTVQAGGDVKLIVHSQTQAQLELSSGGKNIIVNACGQEGKWESRDLSLPLGEGGQTLKLSAAGDIVVTDQDKVNMDPTEKIDQTVTSWNNFAIDLERNIQEKLENASDEIQHAMQKAEEAQKKAMLKIELSSDLGKGKWHTSDRKQKLVNLSFDEPGVAKEKVKGRISDDERMLVLRMLQEKKISVEEADKLLNALDR